jgi:hypothetical protein
MLIDIKSKQNRHCAYRINLKLFMIRTGELFFSDWAILHPTACQVLAPSEVFELGKDRARLARGTNVLNQHWQKMLH